MNKSKRLLALILIFFIQPCLYAQQPTAIINEIKAYIQPYVDTKNFNGTILIAKNGKILFTESFGMANADFLSPCGCSPSQRSSRRLVSDQRQ